MEVPTTSPYDLLCNSNVETALSAEMGTDAILKSFSVEDFTSKGDNFSCIVSCVKAVYLQNGEQFETSFVVKLNPRRSSDFDVFCQLVFRKEIGFYTHLLPLLNRELERTNENPLKLPKHLYSTVEKSKEVVFLEDMRSSGFKLFNRRVGLDKAHTELALRELARLHASSVILMNDPKFQRASITETFPFLRDLFEDLDKENKQMNLYNMLPNILELGAKVAGYFEGYQGASKELQSKINTARDIFISQLHHQKPFQVICHGDCWSSNFLFRYSHDGRVEDCRMLDLQLARVSSPAVDLNLLFYCSLTGDVRQPNMEGFLSHYHSCFASILSKAGLPMKFTLQQLRDEFYKKNMFGLIFALLIVPNAVQEPEDIRSCLHDLVGDDAAHGRRMYLEYNMEVLKTNPRFKQRMLDMFSEMVQSGTLRNDQ